MNSYGYYTIGNQSLAIEEIRYLGFHCFEEFMDGDTCDKFLDKVITLQKQNIQRFGEDLLTNKEVDQVRAPLLSDIEFLRIFSRSSFVRSLCDDLFKDRRSYYVINQQNAVINTNEVNDQAFWHRDFPFVNGLFGNSFCYSFFLCLTDFNSHNGATKVLPFSHRSDVLPPDTVIDRNHVEIEVPKGTLIVFDSMLFHAAGFNSSSEARVGLNTIFTNPILRQQIKLYGKNSDWKHHELDDYERTLLGAKSLSFDSPDDWVLDRIRKQNELE